MGSFQCRQLAIFFMTFLFTCCVAPKCFSCTEKDEGCGDHFGLPNSAAVYCTGTCMKMRGEKYSNSVRLVEVTRMCQLTEREEGCYDSTWNGISVEACACNTDYCNTGTRIFSVSSGHVWQVFLAAAAVWGVHAYIV